MKLRTSIICALSCVGMANAAVVTVDTGFGVGVTDFSNNNVPAGSGYIAVGYFATISDADLANSLATDLATDFQVFGSASSTFGKSGLDGFFSHTANTGGRIDASNPFVGNNIYLVAFNGATLGDSTEGLIYKSGDTFVADPEEPTPPSSQTPAFTLDESSFLMGTVDGELSGAVQVDAARMGQVVPEPSVALLGLLGGLGLLRRRR